ncbi:MAG TPA: hypothetical protein VEJ84_18265 [Acidimicrobiales bacterium]|nr:hypothetical protein [Acidimicrobiales bacterium]
MPKTRPQITRRQLTIADVRAELDTWERKYGVTSEQLAEAFRDPVKGGIVETDDFHSWIMAYETWLELNAS